MTQVERFCWRLPDDVESHPMRAAIPLIEPTDALRRARWVQVLGWYGVGETSPSEPGANRRNLAGRNLVVCVDHACVAIARWYAVAQNRPFRELSKADEIDAILEVSPDTVLFVGRFDAFSAQTVINLNTRIVVPWGLATSVDVAGVSFMLAKQLSLKGFTKRRKHFALIDAINRRLLASISKNSELLTRPLTAPAMMDLLSADWDTLLLHAHGEGAHANLEHAVLCGRVGETEQGIADGLAIAGCRKNGDRPICKRARVETPVVLFGDVRATRICLFSCNGFSIHGDHYPSNVSCAGAVVEGFPAMLLCNDRPGHATEDFISQSIKQLSGGAGLAVLCRLQNQQQSQIDGDKPWVLLGDPIADENRVLIGSRMPRSVRRSRRVSDEERNSSASAARLKLLSVWLRRTGRCADFEFNLASLVEGNASSAEERLTALADLRSSRRALEDALRLAIRWFLLNGTRTSLTADAEVVWRVAASNVSEWDELFARLVATHFENIDMTNLVLDGYSIDFLSTQNTCSRCGSNLTRLKGNNLAEGPPAHALRCPTCGPSSTWGDLAPLTATGVPQQAHPGDVINLECDVGAVETGTASMPGYLAVLLQDKSKGQPVFRSFLTLSSGRRRIKVKLPADIGYDLHTIRILHVRALELRSLRLRVPCVPRLSER